MLDRILVIMAYFQFSPSRFAEEIGVQRSGISHILSGRNKPSLDFIQKILIRFPEIESNWLLTGNDEMLRKEMTGNGVSDLIIPPVEHKEEKAETALFPEPVRASGKKKGTESAGNPVEKIIFLYRDKTFREYFPRPEDQ